MAHRAGESFAYCGGFVFRKAGKRFCFSLPLNEQIDRKRFIHSLSLLFKVYFGVCLSYERRVLSHHSLDFLFDICYNQGASLICKYHYAVVCSRRRLFLFAPILNALVVSTFTFRLFFNEPNGISRFNEQSTKCKPVIVSKLLPCLVFNS